MDRSAKAFSSVPCASSNGPGTRHESAKTWLTGQPQARTLESSPSDLHRASLSKTFWQLSAGSRNLYRGKSQGDRREEGRKARTPATCQDLAKGNSRSAARRLIRLPRQPLSASLSALSSVLTGS